MRDEPGRKLLAKCVVEGLSSSQWARLRDMVRMVKIHDTTYYIIPRGELVICRDQDQFFDPRKLKEWLEMPGNLEILKRSIEKARELLRREDKLVYFGLNPVWEREKNRMWFRVGSFIGLRGASLHLLGFQVELFRGDRQMVEVRELSDEDVVKLAVGELVE